MTGRRLRRFGGGGLFRASLAFATAALLTGCAAVSDISGAIAGLAAGAATANPAVGIGVGIGVRAATAEMLRHVARVRQASEQDAISAAIGDAAPGESRPWSLDRNVGADTHGEVRVLRVIDTPIATCREIAFSVLRPADTGDFREWFTTVACRDGHTWKWATAEPAVDRWTNLQ